METKFEKNFGRYAILFVAFVTVSATSFFGLRSYSDYRKVQQEIQEKRDRKPRLYRYFKRIFGSIQPSQGRVTFYLNPRPRSPAFLIPSQPGDAWFKGYRSFSEGESFVFTDQHYGASYKIDRIESDGVVMLVDANGIHGHIKLIWR